MSTYDEPLFDHKSSIVPSEPRPSTHDITSKSPPNRLSRLSKGYLGRTKSCWLDVGWAMYHGAQSSWVRYFWQIGIGNFNWDRRWIQTLGLSLTICRPIRTPLIVHHSTAAPNLWRPNHPSNRLPRRSDIYNVSTLFKSGAGWAMTHGTSQWKVPTSTPMINTCSSKFHGYSPEEIMISNTCLIRCSILELDLLRLSIPQIVYPDVLWDFERTPQNMTSTLTIYKFG